MTAADEMRIQSISRALIAATMLGGCAGEAATGAKYAADACRRIELIDQTSGVPVVGAEDLAFDAAARRLYISAYDRRAVETAVGKSAFVLPQGGVYALSLDRLLSGDASLTVASIVSADLVVGGLRPHGMSFDPVAREISFVNRSYQKVDGRWRMAPRVEKSAPDAKYAMAASAIAPCAANDLIGDPAGGGGALVTFDHGECGWRGALEDALRLKRSGVADASGAAVFEGALFANGIVSLLSGDIAVGATRERAILVLARAPDGYVERSRIDLPGGPDNLTISESGRIVAAVHPSMARLAAHRKLGLGKAPSRILEVDAETGAVDILFDDRSGDLFSAATAAVRIGDVLVAGSATDRGLLLCGTGA